MSTGGQVVGGVVGAVAGFFIGGGPTGALYGAQIGIMAGGYLDPPKGPTVNGPRLNDLTVQTSTYGAVIPRVYGTVSVNGNVIWLQGNALTETVTKKKSGGKGGGSKTTTKTFTYSATFAVGLCEGPIIGVRRIWVGPDLIYDAGSSDPDTLAASNAAAAGFAIYLGSDTQAPDPRIQSDVGVDNAPAWRGLAYIVLYDLALARYSNSLMGAQVRVEVVKNGSFGNYVASYGSFTNTRNWSYQSPTSWSGSVFLSLDGGGAIGATSPDGLVWTEHALPVSASWFGNAFGAGLFVIGKGNANQYLYTSPDGTTWTAQYLGGTSYSIRSIAWNGAMFLATTYWQDFLTSTNGISWVPRTHPRTNNFAFCAWNGSRWVATCATLGVVVWSGDGISWTEQAMPGTGFDRIAAVGATFCAFRNSDRHVAISTDGVSWTESAATGISMAIETLTSANGIFFAGAISNQFWTSSDGVAWTAHALAINKAWHGACFDGVGISMVDSSLAQCVYIRLNLLNIVDPGLDTVVLAECVSSGLLTAPDVDVSALAATTVRGYRIGSIGALRAAIEPLQAAWPFDVRQHGYKVQFVARGGASVVTIPAADLDARAGGAAPGVQITTSREMDSQIAKRVTVQHLDYAREYDAGSQYAERLNTEAVNALVLDLPIVMTSAEAAGVAEVLLYVYWLERHDVSFALPPTYNQIEPGDVVTLTTPEGNVSLRLTGVGNTSDGRVECTAKYANAAVYTPAALGEPSAVTGTTTIAVAGASRYALLDVPLVHSLLESPGFLAGMYGQRAGWTGGVLVRSVDSGATWADVQGFVAPGAAMGYAVDTIGDVDSRMIDKASRLTISLSSGALYSITELQMLAGGNHFAYGAHGRWEIIAAQTCALQADGSYILSDLLRGRYGTEWAMSLHAAGDDIVLLDTDDLAVIGMNTAQIGLSLLYRGITEGQDISTDVDRAFAYAGANLECLSPVFFRAYRDPASGDWSCDWVRRTRTGGEWRDYVDASLGESSEGYEVDFFSDGAYTTVKRTLAVAAAACVYTAAQQVADFGYSQSRIYAKVYQMSSIVGRGYPLSGYSAIGPVGSRFTSIADVTYLERLPPALQTLDETFPADTGFTKYTESSAGTTSVASNKYTITHVGAKNDIVVKNTISFAAPLAWVEAAASVTTTGATGYDNGGVGIVKDANNFLFASMDRLANTVRLQIKIGGTTTFIGTIAQTWGTSFKLGLSLVANSACVWIDTGSGWTYKLGADVSAYYDFRTTGNLSGWNPGFTLANGGGNSTWDWSAFRAGSFGGVGMRDQTLVTDEYAAPYFPSADVIMFSATIADPRGTAYCGVFTLNLTTLALAQVSAIMVSRSGKTYNDLSAHIIRYAGGNRRMLISTWGNGFGGSIQTLHELFTSGDVLAGVNVVTMTAITLPGQTGALPGAYDAMMAWDGSQWLIAYTLTDDTAFSGNPFYPALATSAAMSTFSLVAKDSTAGRGYEGTKLINDSGVFYMLAGGPAGTGNSSRAYDVNLNFLGALDATFSGGADTQPHPMMFAHGGGRKILTFDNSRFSGGGFTWGHLRLLGAT